MISKIELRNMKFYAYHGVLPQERLVGNHFVVNLILTAPLDEAVSSDDPARTINYATVYTLVADEMNTPSKLLEHVAGRILRSLRTHFPQITEIEVSLAKLNPPLGGDVHSAVVILKE
ncbi:7,8-dihydroneopterin aldolase [Bacteroidia bacterium]|nr:7,8-dihydroneopterin aldolase [Bacteroidia bacterium]GHU55814.1 7,8-dihydroneopterin aldolase [Bacteroidia bacterium]GHU84892.1 7,8-dihydroneopterin aldolase [Bacteroidia bacterium]GHV04464.1 7,8-dihydroneopterin aldolase [Bacteroidia bacterium]